MLYSGAKGTMTPDLSLWRSTGPVTSHAQNEEDSYDNQSTAPFDAARAVHCERHHVCDDAPRGSGFRTDGELPAPAWTKTMSRKDSNGC